MPDNLSEQGNLYLLGALAGLFFICLGALSIGECSREQPINNNLETRTQQAVQGPSYNQPDYSNQQRDYRVFQNKPKPYFSRRD